MEYHNQLPEEGINTSNRHPLLEFVRLSVAAFVALVLLGLLLNAAGGRLGGLVPYRMEVWIADRIDSAFRESGVESPFSSGNNDTALMRYLSSLSEKVQLALGMEAAMSIRLHYSSEDVFNAFATVGGHVYLYRGLLQELPHENALVMLMAHEYSHVQLRHTARGVGGGLAVAVGSAILPGGGGVESRLYSMASLVSNLNFSRDMESEADLNALRAVERIYGHVNGAGDLFALFAQARGENTTERIEAFFSTHPMDEDRVSAIRSRALEMNWETSGVLSALPTGFRQWLDAPR